MRQSPPQNAGNSSGTHLTGARTSFCELTRPGKQKGIRQGISSSRLAKRKEILDPLLRKTGVLQISW